MLKPSVERPALQPVGRRLPGYQPVGLQGRGGRAPNVLLRAASFLETNLVGAVVQRFGRACFECRVPALGWGGLGRGAAGAEVHCYYSPVPFGLEVTYLWTDPEVRGLGVGTQLLDTLVQFADHTGVALRLWAGAFERGRNLDDPDTYRLAAWYASRFGFQPVRSKREGTILFIRMTR